MQNWENTIATGQLFDGLDFFGAARKTKAKSSSLQSRAVPRRERCQFFMRRAIKIAFLAKSYIKFSFARHFLTNAIDIEEFINSFVIPKITFRILNLHNRNLLFYNIIFYSNLSVAIRRT